MRVEVSGLVLIWLTTTLDKLSLWKRKSFRTWLLYFLETVIRVEKVCELVLYTNTTPPLPRGSWILKKLLRTRSLSTVPDSRLFTVELAAH